MKLSLEDIEHLAIDQTRNGVQVEYEVVPLRHPLDDPSVLLSTATLAYARHVVRHYDGLGQYVVIRTRFYDADGNEISRDEFVRRSPKSPNDPYWFGRTK